MQRIGTLLVTRHNLSKVEPIFVEATVKAILGDIEDLQKVDHPLQ